MRHIIRQNKLHMKNTCFYCSQTRMKSKSFSLHYSRPLKRSVLSFDLTPDLPDLLHRQASEPARSVKCGVSTLSLSLGRRISTAKDCLPTSQAPLADLSRLSKVTFCVGCLSRETDRHRPRLHRAAPRGVPRSFFVPGPYAFGLVLLADDPV